MRNFRLVGLLLVLVLCGLGNPGAQEAPPAAEGPLPSGITEQVEVMLFQLNFLARDKRGRPVTDLKAEEIKIIDQGAVQRIAYFEPYYPQGEISLGAGQVAGPSAAVEAKPAPAAPAKTERGRWVLFFFDNYASNLGTRVQALEAAEKYVDESLRPDDLVAVVSFTGELHLLQSFTNDRLAILNALRNAMQQTERAITDRYGELDYLMEAMETCKNQALQHACARRLSGAYEDERRREADSMMRALTHLLRSLASIPDAKMLVMFSNGFARSSTSDPIDAARVVLGDEVANGIFFGQEFVIDKWYDELVAAAVRARVSIFTINPGGSSRNYLSSAERGRPLDEATNVFQVDVFGRSDKNFQASLSDMSRRTGGTSTQSGDVRKAIDNILELSSGLYTVGYYPNRKLPSAPHDVKIRISRKGVKAVWPRDVPRLQPPMPLRGAMSLEPQACSDQGRRHVALKLELELDSLMFETVQKTFVNDFSMYLTFIDERSGRTLSRDFRFFNVSYGAKGTAGEERVNPIIEKTLVVPCRPLLVQAAAVDAVSGARIDFEQQLP